MSKEIKNKIVPKLRFSEFKDDGDMHQTYKVFETMTKPIRFLETL